jgi:hypothetical protein
MSDQSSCDPSALFHFCQEEQKRTEQLAQLKCNLNQALNRFFGTCPGFNAIGHPEQIVGPLHTHAERIEQIAAWVSGVAQDFADADGGGQAFFVAPLQQTLPISLEDATLDVPPPTAPQLNLERPAGEPAFFVAPL